MQLFKHTPSVIQQMENLRDVLLRNGQEISSILNGKIIDVDIEVDRNTMLAGIIEVITGPKRTCKSVFVSQSVTNPGSCFRLPVE